MSVPEAFNLLEVVLWSGIGAVFLWRAAAMAEAVSRRMARVAGLLFLAFGVSDLVEMRTGAWWDPWWLLAWKSLCVAGLISVYGWWRLGRTPALR